MNNIKQYIFYINFYDFYKTLKICIYNVICNYLLIVNII